ncbi:hypothetical protein NEMBOFW57_006377 [Staphylotrichum longicolle]|uniref:ZZ-type domain-containing protein n=1 Tax=Staphylotrichum longicolle TaxID=669026 RepID=A0AAD4I2J4_9PEZI|nr:hypothetical protein NEMBOFW57_006377 [Staphylotrichum longicolle]
MSTFFCNSCEENIPFGRARLRCLTCPDYDSCADCYAGCQAAPEWDANCTDRDGHVGSHKAPVTAKDKHAVAGFRNTEAYWGVLITPAKTASPIFSRLITAIFEYFAAGSADVLQPSELCAFMATAGHSKDFLPLQMPNNESAPPADLHRLDAWLADWYQSFPLDHRMTTREFPPPPPVQPHQGRIRLRDQLLHAVLHPTAPVVPNGLPLLSRRGLEQYLMFLAAEDPSDLSTRLNNILLTLPPLTDGKTGRRFDASLIPQVVRARMLEKQQAMEKERRKKEQEEMARRKQAEDMVRQQQAQQMAFQQQMVFQQQVAQQQQMAYQQQVMARRMAPLWQQTPEMELQRMRKDHIINKNSEEVRFNCAGGWKVDSSGNRVYHPGY